jgi:AcrR family transcriptional regulator
MEKKEQLYDIALKLFVDSGYDSTPMSLIAKRAGLSKAGLYHYFNSKEELLFLMHEYYLERDFIPIIEAAEKIPDPQKRIAYCLRNYTKIIAHSEGPRVFIQEIKKLRPQHRKRINQIWRRAFNVIRDAISEMEIARRIKKTDHTFASFAAVGMCSWLLYWFDYSRKESAEEVAETFCDIFFKGILANEK